MLEVEANRRVSVEAAGGGEQVETAGCDLNAREAHVSNASSCSLRRLACGCQLSALLSQPFHRTKYSTRP